MIKVKTWFFDGIYNWAPANLQGNTIRKLGVLKHNVHHLTLKKEVGMALRKVHTAVINGK